jgi:histidinol-phosphate aminotransferase
VTYEYERPPEVSGLRLHLNEHTGGCSPRVIEALSRIDRHGVAFYPDYGAAERACAARLGVPVERVLLTNGLDEGILVATIAAACRDRDAPARALVVQPAFDMYAACASATGMPVDFVGPLPGFRFPIEAVLEALTGEVRIVFLTNPGNPTGQLIPVEAIRAIARRAPHALILVDEAYADFSGVSFLDELDAHPNVLVGRTFAKAYGLAALRIGALVACGPTLAPIRRIVPPYSVNACAAIALVAALDDTAYVEEYVRQSAQSRRAIYDACERLGLTCWPSAANFVLVRVGERCGEVVAALAARGVHVRNRSGDPGCAGCIRITAGLVPDTARCLTAIEEVLCGAA